MARNSDSTKLVIELARAFNLLDIYPLRHPTVQDVVREVDRRLDGLEESIELVVEEGGISVDGRRADDRQGNVATLAGTFRDLGVSALRLGPGASGADVERILSVLRDREKVARAGSFSGAVASAGGTRVEIDDEPVAGVEGAAAGDEAGAGPGGGEDDEGLVIGRGDSMYEAMRRKDYEDVDLAELADRILTAEPGEREDLERRLAEAAARHRQELEHEPLADALEVLAGGITDDMSPELQKRLYDAVLELATPGAVETLVERLGEAARRPERRDVLVHALTRVGSDAARAVADALSEAKDRAARRAYLETLVEFGRVHGMSLVEGMLEDDRWFVVRNAVTIVGEVGGEEALDYLTPALAHDDPRVRKEAVAALSKIGGEDAAALILGVLNDPDPGVRSATSLALGVHKVERAVRPLLERLESEESEDVEVEILRALGRIGDASAVQAIEKRTSGGLFSRPPKRIRIAALRALGAIGTPHARSILERAADERDPDVSQAARASLQGT